MQVFCVELKIGQIHMYPAGRLISQVSRLRKIDMLEMSQLFRYESITLTRNTALTHAIDPLSVAAVKASASDPSLAPLLMKSETSFVSFHYIPNWDPSVKYAQFFAPHFQTFLSLIHQHSCVIPTQEPLEVYGWMYRVQDEFDRVFPVPPSSGRGWYRWSSVGLL